MSEEVPVTASADEEFRLVPGRGVRELIDTIVHAVPDLPTWSGYFTLESGLAPVRTYRTAKLSEWLALIDQHPDFRQGHASFQAQDERQLSFTVENRISLLRVSLTGRPEQLDALSEAVLSPLREILPVISDRMDRHELIEVRRAYLLPQLPDTATVRSAAERISTELAEQRFEGQLETGGVTRTFGSIPGWADALKSAAGTDPRGFWLTGGAGDCDLRFRYREARLDLTVRAPTQERAVALINQLAADLGASVPVTEGGFQDLVGEQRLLWTRSRPTREWFEKLCAEIEELGGGRNQYYTGELLYRESADVWRTYSALAAHRAAAGSRWDELAQLRLRASYPTVVIDTRVDLDRQNVSLRLEALDESATQRGFARLLTALDLEPAPVPEFALRSTVDYEVVSWRNGRLAEALTAVLHQFVGEHPVLIWGDSRLADEKGRVETFRTTDQMLARIGDDARGFTELHLVVEGPRGAALGVHLESDDARTALRVRSSLEGARFEQLCRPLVKATAAKTVAAEPKATAPAPERPWVKFVVPLIALAAGFVLSPAFFTAVFADDTLRIRYPVASGDGDAAPVVSPRVTVDWVVEHRQWFHREIRQEEPAVIRVFQNGRKVQELGPERPGVVLDLPNGRSHIEVIDRSSGESAAVDVVVG